jgi:hypothetical protein
MAISSEDQSPQESNEHRREDAEHTEHPDEASPQRTSDHDERSDEDQEITTQKEDNVEPPLPDDTAPPLPAEEVPPLPDEAPPLPAETPPVENDGWEPKWDERTQAYYFFNRFTGVSQWENPRVPEAVQPPPPGVTTSAATEIIEPVSNPVAGGYDPAIHGDYDPNADYAQVQDTQGQAIVEYAPGTEPTAAYVATGAFNRFTGKWQAATLNPENFNDENKSKRQMNAFFDVDAAANSHDGKSLKAERAGKKLSKQELKAFKEKRREKKEEKRRAWLRD